MTNDGISSRFREKYNEADNLLSNKKFDQAKNILNEITEDFAKNLTEQALNAWLHAHYFLSQQDWVSYSDSVTTAHRLREHLPTKMAIRNTQNLLEWQKIPERIFRCPVHIKWNAAYKTCHFR